MKLIFVAAAILIVGCTPPEEKVNKLISNALTECQASEGPFFDVEVNTGKDAILKDVCGMPIEGIEIIEQFTAKATVGPYEITAGIDEETDVWVLTGVKWNDLKKAMRTTGDGAEKGALEQGLPMWQAAQASVPESTWIRNERFKSVLELRRKTRGKDANPVGLGPAQPVFDEMLKWAAEKNPDFEQQLRADVVEYHQKQSDKLDASLENIGGQDEWFESLIKQARKDGNSEDAQKYQKELDDSLAGRDAKIDRINERVADAKKFACEEVVKLNSAKVKDETLRKRIVGVRSGLDCS